MKYFEFVMSEVHGLRIKELMNDRINSKIAVGSYCVFTPEELIIGTDGVIHYGLQFCQPYIIESHNVEISLEKDGMPTLSIETDYGQQDIGQLKTRVEAFVEMLNNK